jgi:hypothetical protein
VFEFAGSPVAVPGDVRDAFGAFWDHLAGPGATLTGSQRVAVAAASRGDDSEGADQSLLTLARHLGLEPGTVFEEQVRRAADTAGDPATVETIGVVSLLSAVDGMHDALGVEREPLPEPRSGEPTGEVADGLKRRRTHVPMPQGAIPLALDLVPAEGRMRIALSAPIYMPDDEMIHPDWRRRPGLVRPQMEVVAARTSWHNDCFY